MQRNAPLRRPGKPLKRRGKRTARWEAERRRLKLKIWTERCELGLATGDPRFNTCWGTGDSMAHAVKRRFLRKDAPVGTPEHIGTVAVACLNCHRIADEMLTHAEMRTVIMEAIARRD